MPRAKRPEARGGRTGRTPSAAKTNVVVRLDAELLAWLDAETQRRRAAAPGREVTRSDVVRECLAAAMAR